MVSLFGGQEGQAMAIGLSTDEKPIPLQDYWLFIEVDTGITFHSLGGEWIQNNN